MQVGGSRLKRYELLTMTLEERKMIMRRSSRDVFDDALFRSVEGLINDVRQNGDAALVRATAQFDGIQLQNSDLKVRPEEFEAAERQLSPAVLDAIDEAIDHVRRFNQHIVDRTSWQAELAPGIFVGEQASPIDRVGLYVPCRKGSFPSVMIHLGTPAVTAGVPDIAVVLPPLPGGGGIVDPAVLAVAGRLGISEVYRCNGVAGIAALALGTETIRPVRRIDGPGSPGVTAAQLAVQRFGVAVGLLYGPSEAVILADGSADPDLLAADLLNDAEHGSDSAALLLTDRPELIDAVARCVASRLPALPDVRRGYAEAAISQYGGAILVHDLDSAIDFINEYAPEHLQLAVASPESFATRIRNAGEILLGQGTPFAAANFSVGVPNTLPTGGFAHLSSAVTAHTYLKRSSIARLDAAALAALRPGVRALAEHEGFPAHAAAMGAEGR
ncbi:MAG: hisD [Chloroflexi bacterium]|nr:hisD [Chloroflexota bacterium]